MPEPRFSEQFTAMLRRRIEHMGQEDSCRWIIMRESQSAARAEYAAQPFRCGFKTDSLGERIREDAHA